VSGWRALCGCFVSGIAAHDSRTAKQCLRVFAANRSLRALRWARTPSLLWLHRPLGLTAESMFALLCVTGCVLAAAAACGAAHWPIFAGLWALYLSFVNVGGSFLEAG
jgi:hypothetical protein